MKKLLVLICAAFVVFGCSKDKFETKPQLTLVGLNGNLVPSGGKLIASLEYTDKEGDVQDTLYMVRYRINKRGPSVYNYFTFLLPDFPNTQKGELEVGMDQASVLSLQLPEIHKPGTSNSNEIDSLVLKFVLKDKAGNRSDTLVVPDIYVIR